MTEEDEALVGRIRPFMKRRKGYSEQKMFGGDVDAAVKRVMKPSELSWRTKTLGIE